MIAQSLKASGQEGGGRLKAVADWSGTETGSGAIDNVTGNGALCSLLDSKARIGMVSTYIGIALLAAWQWNPRKAGSCRLGRDRRDGGRLLVGGLQLGG